MKYGKKKNRIEALETLFKKAPEIDRSEKVRAIVFEETAKLMGEKGYLN